MFRKEPSLIDQEIDNVLRELKHHAVDSKEYATILARLVTLYDLKGRSNPESVSKNTMATIGANLLGIFMIIKHEHVNVITSRALNLLMKPK